MSTENSEDSQPPEKKGKGRPKKSPGTGMIARNISLSRHDEKALKELAANLQLYYALSRRSSNEAIGASWAVRALIRLADRQTRGWMLAEPNEFLKELASLGDVDL